MTDTELLEWAIKESGLKKGYLANAVGLSRAGFKNCCTNEAEFNATHIRILCKELPMAILAKKRGTTALKLKDAIFFKEPGA